MTEPRQDPRPSREAASWFARLGRRAVTTESLRAFRDWRKDPANAQAYAEVESAWSRAGHLADDPEILAAAREALDRRPLRARARDALGRTRPLGWALAGLTAATTATVALLLARPAFLLPAYDTGVGEQRLVVLEDGSRVRLNTNSQIRVRFTRGERRIALTRGEAFFEAAHDASRPFLVDAGQADVRALGTRFDVRREDAAVQVTLVEGRVRVTQDGAPQPWTLAPSQQVTLGEGRIAQVTRVADTGRVTSWTSGRLVFHETPLREAIAEVNRYGPGTITLADTRLASAPVSGVFDTGDSQAFVAAVTTLFDLKAVRARDGAVRLEDGPA